MTVVRRRVRTKANGGIVMWPDGRSRPPAGFRVGHAATGDGLTGVSVVVAPDDTVGAVDVRGAAPGTRETDALDPTRTVAVCHAVVLTGGSALGLATAQGVAEALRAEGRGLSIGGVTMPIVPAAVIFDEGARAGVWPDAALGRRAYETAGSGPVEEGRVGAGTGASVGKAAGRERAVRGGVGYAVERVGALEVGALVVVNAWGDVVADDGRIIAGVRGDRPGTWLSSRSVLAGGAQAADRGHTTLAVVMTNARLGKADAHRVAVMAHDGLARAIVPVHTAWDGDAVFVLAHQTARGSASLVGQLAAEALTRAVRRAVWAARGTPDLPAAREWGAHAAAPRGPS
jgi:L-aminopeptidase/D-esterase-like protein